ncbi:MAG: hypothetical protein R6W92_17130 [Desulfocurvibacter africanus]
MQRVDGDQPIGVPRPDRHKIYLRRRNGPGGAGGCAGIEEKRACEGMKMYDDEFINNLPNDFFIAGLRIVGVLEEVLSFTNSEEELFECYMEFYFCILAFSKSKKRCEIPDIDFSKPRKDVVEQIRAIYIHFKEFGEKRKLQVTTQDLQQKYAVRFNKIFVYRFSDNDFSRLQTLVNEIRDLISSSVVIIDDHKKRLLKRLENLQSELHKSESNLDKFWGLMGDAGVMLGKFGSDIKPIVDRIREVLEIVCRTQAQSEQLPGKLPLALPEKDSAETN